MGFCVSKCNRVTKCRGVSKRFFGPPHTNLNTKITKTNFNSQSSQQTPVLVFWDLQNVSVSKSIVESAIPNLKAILHKQNKIISSINAAVNITDIHIDIRNILQAHGVKMIDCSSRKESACDILLIEEMYQLCYFYMDNPIKPTVALISGDGDFERTLNFLKGLGFDIILIHGRNCASSLKKSMQNHLLWNEVLHPLGISELNPSHSISLYNHMTKLNTTLTEILSPHFRYASTQINILHRTVLTLLDFLVLDGQLSLEVMIKLQCSDVSKAWEYIIRNKLYVLIKDDTTVGYVTPLGHSFIEAYKNCEELSRSIKGPMSIIYEAYWYMAIMATLEKTEIIVRYSWLKQQLLSFDSGKKAEKLISTAQMTSEPIKNGDKKLILQNKAALVWQETQKNLIEKMVEDNSNARFSKSEPKQRVQTIYTPLQYYNVSIQHNINNIAKMLGFSDIYTYCESFNNSTKENNISSAV